MWLGSVVRVVGSSVELAWLLFCEYLAGSTFRHDLLLGLCQMDSALLNGQLGSPSWRIVDFFFSTVRRQCSFRAVECLVMGAFCHGPALCQDAVALHILFPLLQRYQFDHMPVTRIIHAVGRMMFPRFLRSALHFTSGQSGQPSVSASGSLSRLPSEVHSAVQLFAQSYDHSVVYSVLTGNLVQDVSLFVTEQIDWAFAFYGERHKPTSRWRLLGPYLCLCTASVVEAMLSNAARIAGAWVGQKAIRNAAGTGFFWGERAALLLALPLIKHATNRVVRALETKLEARYPFTAEDDLENRRQWHHVEEEEQQQQQIPFSLSSEAAGVSLYKVLGVTPSASSAEIKQAYKNLALKNHPDRVERTEEAQEEARKRMAAINEAYEVLGDDDQRQIYNATTQSSLGVEILLSKLGDTPTFVKIGALGMSAVGTVYGATALLYLHYASAFTLATSPGRSPIIAFYG